MASNWFVVLLLGLGAAGAFADELPDWLGEADAVAVEQGKTPTGTSDPTRRERWFVEGSTHRLSHDASPSPEYRGNLGLDLQMSRPLVEDWAFHLGGRVDVDATSAHGQSQGHDSQSLTLREIYAGAAVLERDAATQVPLLPLVLFRGYRALQAHRIAHQLWSEGRRAIALWVQSRIVDVHSIDIHPAARVGRGVMFDHGTGIVIGETAVIDDGVSILHGVTLGGTGSSRCDRHPKVRQGALIGAGATILGNIEVGTNARVAAGSIVVKPVPADATMAGLPARERERTSPRQGALPVGVGEKAQ